MEQIDTLKNGYKIIQDSESFQFGIDAILLADFAAKEIKEGNSIIDLGTGTGIIPLLMEKRAEKFNNVKFTGLEVQRASADMAARSVSLNGLDERIKIINGDLTNLDGHKNENKNPLFQRHSFNIVTCNPPYMIDDHGKSNVLDALSIARHEILCTLEDVVAAADYLLAPHGKFFMIHRPFRLPEIFEELSEYKLEAKRMRLIHPFANKDANMVMIEARKNAKRRLTIEPPLIVRNDDGNYTDEINKIYSPC